MLTIVAAMAAKRYVMRADEKLTAFVELERQVLTMTFYLESIRAGDRDTNFTNSHESTPT